MTLNARRIGTLRSIRNRLTLLFFSITLAAVGVVYFHVAPSLESNLRSQRLHALALSAGQFSGPLRRAVGSSLSKRAVDRQVREAADRANLRVTLLGISRGTLGTATYTIADSQGVGGVSQLRFPLAVRTARDGRAKTGTEAGPGGQVGEAAQPLFFNGVPARVAVFSTPLSDVASNGALIRRRIQEAGAVAMLLAILAGYAIARAFSLRIKRLEQTAGRVSAGDFSARFPVDSEDELGQLARALDDMQHQLAELDDARKQFIATASHELRTPIFSLGGFLELIQDEELDDQTRRQFVGQVREQVDRLGQLATGLLDLSRLEAGSLELRPERTDLSVLTKAVAAEFIPALSQHSSHLQLQLPRGPISAVCDPERVAQIMRILIDNALTHTPAGTDIRVTARRHNGATRMAVHDDGPGIKAAALGRIFEPFYTSDGVEGSGLGLAIARELAERMNGALRVESAPGTTTFTLDLGA